MKLIKILAVIALINISLVSCTEQEVKDEGDVMGLANTTALVLQAKNTFNEINELGGAWSETEDMITEADKLLKMRQLSQADALANTAIMQNKLATMQYESQKNAGPLY